MRLAVIRLPAGTHVASRHRVVVDRGDHAVVTEYADLAAAARARFEDDALGDELADLPRVEKDGLAFVSPAGPGAKVVCVGHNYRAHILEMGHELPSHPNVFSKYPEAVVGAHEDIELDPLAERWDWEAELALVVGRSARRVAVADARSHMLGFTIANDISARDWQRRATQWLLGKTFENTTPVGPWIVTPDEVDPDDGLAITCEVNGVRKQSSSTADLVFPPDELLSYLSGVVTLNPGDLVLTGTPGGVAAAEENPSWLQPGDLVTTSIDGIGRLVNRCVTNGNPSYAGALAR